MVTAAGLYRSRAADCDARARAESDPLVRAEWENMARWYRRLAEQAAKNAQTDVVYENPPERPGAVQPQQQQQQQQQQQKPREGDKDE
jgi:hypothetical protein